MDGGALPLLAFKFQTARWYYKARAGVEDMFLACCCIASFLLAVHLHFSDEAGLVQYVAAACHRNARPAGCRPPDRQVQTEVPADRLAPEARRPVVLYLLDTYPRLLESRNNNESTPLIVAAYYADDSRLTILELLLSRCQLANIVDAHTKSGELATAARICGNAGIQKFFTFEKVIFCDHTLGSEMCCQHAYIDELCARSIVTYLRPHDARCRAARHWVNSVCSLVAGYLAYHIASQRGHKSAIRLVLQRLEALLPDYNKRKKKRGKDQEVRKLEECIYDVSSRHYKAEALHEVCQELGFPVRQAPIL